MSLNRFIVAQADGVYETALAQLTAGRKTGHWIWFIFPQLRGLGLSHTSNFYGLESSEEAAAYLAHPLLGTRLLTCAEAMQAHGDDAAATVLGDIDAIKFRSCLTLFAQLPGAPPVFDTLLGTFFDGVRDPNTSALLKWV